ncbi:MAG: ArsA-related P-loop ATPase [Bdellovibrionota bacterium]
MVDIVKLVDLIDRYKVVVILGPGGVGKTTCSIATAMAAARNGKRVGLLSIDPAKRLAAALGLSLGNELKEIKVEQPDVNGAGSIEAAMLDQKAVFDAMVLKHAPTKATADKILQHKLYVAASSKLAGPLEYMALAKLYEMVESKKYDLIVLDTPPDTNALDFLKRPNLLAGFMENKVMSWMVKPFYLASKLGAGRLFSTGEKLMGGVAKVTGFKALAMLAEFLVLLQEVIEGFHKTGERIVTILNRPDTGFFLVSVPALASGRSAKNLARQIVNMGFSLDLVLFNRCLPARIVNLLNDNKDTSAIKNKVQLLEKLAKRLEGEQSSIAHISNSLNDYTDRNVPIHRIEEQDYDLHSGEGIYRFSQDFETGAES